MENNFNIKEIVRIESRGKNTIMFFSDGFSEIVGNSIDELEKEFSEWNFVRIHPHHLINPKHYKKASLLSSPAIEMSDGTLLPADSNLLDLSEELKPKSWWRKIFGENRNKYTSLKIDIMKKQLLTLIIVFLSIAGLAQDYSIPMAKQYWTTTYAGPLEEVASSLKCYTVGWKNGNSMRSRQIFNLLDKDIYIKWEKNDGSDGTDMTGRLGIKGTRAVFDDLYNASKSPNDTWLYTMIHVNSGDSSLVVTTCTNNYYNQGGSTTYTDYNYQKVVPSNWHRYVNGVISFDFKDVVYRHAYIEVAEVIVADGSPKLLETAKLYDFNTGVISDDITTYGTWVVDTINSPNGNSMFYHHALSGRYFQLDVTNANAVKIRYKANYDGSSSAPDYETVTGCAVGTADSNLDTEIGVNTDGTTLFDSKWQDVIIPVCDTATTNFKLQFYKNYGDIWVDEIRVLKEKSSNSTPTLIELTNSSFKENSAPGTVVGVVNVSDADANDKHFLEFVEVSGYEDNDYFRFKGDTLILKKTISYEDTTSLNIHIQAIDESLASIDVPFTINVIDVNEFAPTVGVDQIFSVDENSVEGIKVGNVAAVDEDGDAILAYSITSGNDDGLFAINSSTGEITVASAGIDYENTTQYSLGVEVSDGSLSDAGTVTININDVNEAPVITASQVFSIDENSTTGTTVGSVLASDVDAGASLTYSILLGPGFNGGFLIDSSTGELTSDMELDFETTASYTFTVHITDGTLTDDEEVTININDVNEAPIVEDGQLFNIDENSRYTVLGILQAEDEDANSTIYFDILSSDYDGAFSIEHTTGKIIFDPQEDCIEIDPETGEMDCFDMYPLNYEASSQYTLEIMVYDNGSLSDTTIVTIDINDINEAPRIGSSQVFDIDENSAVGTLTGKVIATDEDAGATLTYSITSGNDDGLFAINSSNGDITVASAGVDYETTIQYSLGIEVSDGSLSDAGTVTVNVNNINDNAPVIESAEVTIDEGTANGTVIYTLVYSDADGDLNPLTFTPTAGHDALDLNGDDIVVVDQTKLDYETDPTVVLTGTISDGTYSDNATLTIHLNNINDNTPAMANVALNVPERESNGRVVFTFGATDADGSLNPITYTFVSGHSHQAFEISGDELIVADGSKIDYETEPTINMQVEISDGTHSSTADITINVTDVADNAPSITAQPQSVEVCDGSQAMLNVTAEGDGTLSYDWLENGISLGKPNSSTLVFQVGEANETSNYSCKVTNEFGEIISQSATAKMREPLTVDLGKDKTITTSESVLLDAGAGFTTYMWSDDSDGQTLLFSGGDYGVGVHNVIVRVYDDLGCTAVDDVNVEVSVTTAIPESEIKDVKIYPNPAKEFIFAEVTGISEPTTIEFINMAGQKVLVKPLPSGQSTMKIDLTSLRNGMYIVRIYNDNYQKTERIIIR